MLPEVTGLAGDDLDKQETMGRHLVASYFCCCVSTAIPEAMFPTQQSAEDKFKSDANVLG